MTHSFMVSPSKEKLAAVNYAIPATERRDYFAAHTATYLAKGNKITQLPPGASAYDKN